MAFPVHAVHQLRRYSTSLPRDAHYRLKATLMAGYLVGGFTLPFVPPLLESRRSRADGSYLTRQNVYCSSPYLGCAR